MKIAKPETVAPSGLDGTTPKTADPKPSSTNVIMNQNQRQESMQEQLVASGVPESIAYTASIDLANGLGAQESWAIAAAYTYIAEALAQRS